MINTNLGSLFNMCRNVIEGMRERKFGRIVNISSINGQKGQFGQTNYSAAKAGEIGFTKALAQESARAGITVNAIAPGYINTEMVQAVPKDVLEKNILPLIPIGRLGEPEEIARCVVFLASDDAGLITGSTLSAQRRAVFRLIGPQRRIAMQSAVEILDQAVAGLIPRQIVRADRRLAVAAGNVQHVGRLAQAGQPAAQRAHQLLAALDRGAQVRRAGREIAVMQVVRLDAAFDQARASARRAFADRR